MASSKWLDRTQPQTLYMATILLYINAAFSLLSILEYGALVLGTIGVVLLAGEIIGGWGVANEKKLGYWLAIGVSIGLTLLTLATFGTLSILNLIFDVALVALLLHPMSRDYTRIWFR